MSRTIAMVVDAEGNRDIGTELVSGLESLRQRVEQRLRFRLGSWALDTREGTEPVIGRRFTPQAAASILTAAVLAEGADEITGTLESSATFDHDNRVLSYRFRGTTIYEDLAIVMAINI